MTTPDVLVYPRLVQLAGCLCSEIASCGLPELCICTPMPGAGVAMDYVSMDNCDGGMGWVRLTTAYPFGSFPAPLVSGNNCSSPLAMTVEVGVIRPFSIPENGEAPDADTLLAATEAQMADMAAMRRAISCCFDPEETLLGQYTPYGPQGGALGGSWVVVIDASMRLDDEV